MSKETDSVSRRSVLKATAGAVPVAGAGLASGSGGNGTGGNAKYNVGYSAASGRAAAHDAATEVVREYAFDALTVQLPGRAVAGLRDRPDVRYVEENGAMSLDVQTLPWGVDRIDADRIRGVEGGDGVHVAVLDTGIDSDHADLEANLGTGTAFEGDGGGSPESWDDDEGHGTAAAGIVGAIDDSSDVVGVAPSVTLHSVQVCDTLGEGGCEFDEAAAGLEWVADQGYEVANMSFSGDHSDVLDDAVTYAAEHDVLMVGSAGNDGPCTDCVNYPASDDFVVAVSAIESDEELWDGSSQGPEIDLAAPTNVATTDLGGGTTGFGGTSAAAPHVSGTAALIRARLPTRNLAERQLFDKAEDLGLSFNEQGHGLVDAEAVVEEPLVETSGSRTPSAGTQTLDGELHYLGEASSADVYFEWGQEGDGLPNQTTPETLSSPGAFSHDVTNVLCDVIYEFRAVVDASDGDGDVGIVRGFKQPCDDDGDCCTF